MKVNLFQITPIGGQFISPGSKTKVVIKQEGRPHP
jgi:hypothetical protein